MYCKCTFTIKYLCITCETLICGNSKCDKGAKEHNELCPDLKAVLLTGEIEYNFWRKYYVNEIKSINKQINDISMKIQEIISTVYKLSKFALENLEKKKGNI